MVLRIVIYEQLKKKKKTWWIKGEERYNNDNFDEPKIETTDS